jgi:AraC-like DNA-binding protein
MRVSRIRADRTEGIEFHLRAIEQEQGAQQSGSEAAISLHTQLFWLECARSARACGMHSTQSPDDASAAWAERARRKLDADLQRAWTLDDLAGQVGLSKSYLSRSFRRYTGRTVIAYLTARRIEQAMLLLQTTDRKVLDIAFQCGFRDLSHFNRTFRRHVGTSPRRYRGGRS